MADWEFSESRPTGGGDYDCGCACCYADENHPEHEADCPIGQAAADLARVTAERDEWEEMARTLGAQSTSRLADKLEAEAEVARLRVALGNLLRQTPCGPNYSTREQARAAAEAALAGEVPGA